MTRRNFTRTVKLAEWAKSGGCCRSCGRKLFPGDGRQYDHRIPDEQGGENTLENCQLLCTGCHQAKTGRDMKVIAKSRSIRASHVGASKPRRTMPGSRDHWLKKRLDGKVVTR